MDIKLEIGGYYKLSDGRVTGPATTWGNPDVAEHYFELPVESASGYKKTIFRADGTTDYADFHVVERAAKPAFVCAGEYYKTADGVTVGPMVGPDVYGSFRSDGNELYAIRNDGVALSQHQQWEDNGVVLAENKHEKGHRLVERVIPKKAGRPKDDDSGKTELTMTIDLAKDGFMDAFRLTTDEFVRQLDIAQKSIDERDAEIERLKGACEYYRKTRDEWFTAWERTSKAKLRGDSRLRLARSRYKVESRNVSICKAHIHDLEVKVASAESKLKKNIVKTVLEHVFAAGLIIASVVAGAVIFA